MAIDLVDGPWMRSDGRSTFDHALVRVVRLCQTARAGETIIGSSVRGVMAVGPAAFAPAGLARFRQFGEEYAFHVLRS